MKEVHRVRFNNRYIKLISFIFFMAIYLLFVCFLDLGSISNGYRITIILPIMYLICFYIFLWKPIFTIRTPFIILFSCVAFIRYVVLSIVTIISGNYFGISGSMPLDESLTLAGILMCWELITTSFCVFYWSKKKINFKNEISDCMNSQANPLIYVMFFLITIVLLIIIPQSRTGLSFFGNINRSINAEIGSLLVLGIRECFINAKYFILFFIIIIFGKKSKFNFDNKSALTYGFIILVCICIIGLRIGTNRKKMLADSLAIILLLWTLFPKYKKSTALVVMGSGVALVAVTTVFRGMTHSALSFFSEYINIDFLQPYFLGQYNVAMAIEAKMYYGEMINIKTYLFSFLRPIFGIGSIIKNLDFNMVANLFDMRMSFGIDGFRGDQIIPMIGEGYMLFGVFLAPILSVIAVRIGIMCDMLYKKSQKLEVCFISSIIAFYVAQFMILNSTIIINMLTFRLAIYIPVVLLAYSCIRKKYMQDN